MANAPVEDAIILSHDATGAHWQLGPLPPKEGAFVLIGWTLPDRDGAVPIQVVNTLARALVRSWRVTFPCSAAPTTSSGWQAQGADWVLTIRLRALGGPSELRLLSTTCEDQVRMLFDDPLYPWWHQGQFALLSRPVTTPPDLVARRTQLENLIEPVWAGELNELKKLGVELILRPAVDGSAAGLLCSSSAVRTEVEESIHDAAGDFGLGCQLLDEDAFMESLAGGEGRDTDAAP